MALYVSLRTSRLFPSQARAVFHLHPPYRHRIGTILFTNLPLTISSSSPSSSVASLESLVLTLELSRPAQAAGIMSDDKKTPPAPEGGSGVPPPKGFEYWRKAVCYMTGMGMNAEETAAFVEEAMRRQKKKQCKQCNENRDWMVSYSPTVRFMLEQVEKVGGNINASNVVCGPCDELRGGGFNPEFGILLCENRLRDKWHLEDTLAHELIHAYDHCKFKVDWSNLRHHACSEIRASNLSGECRFANEFSKGALSLTKLSRAHQECVRRRAALSVAANPKCRDAQHAEQVIDEVWESCFNDTRPFEAIYR